MKFMLAMMVVCFQSSDQASMDFLSSLTPDVRESLFKIPPPGEVQISDVICVDETLDVIGITLEEGTEFVVAFTTDSELCDEVSFARETADRWVSYLPGCVLILPVRLVKFFRADADKGDLYAQEPLGASIGIWAFQTVLTEVLLRYAELRSDIRQFYFLPNSKALDRWYDRISRTFCKAGGAFGSGIQFREIARPAADEGGFYGYERIQA